jgi:uncharacterized metal-binding protein
MANHLAIRLDRLGRAEMSCIAGVGGDVAPLVKLAKSGRPIIAIDGCALHCAKKCLAQRGLEPTHHMTLSDLKVRRTLHADFDPEEAERVLEELLELTDAAPASPSKVGT